MLRKPIVFTGVFLLTAVLWYATTLDRLPSGFAARYYAGSDLTNRPTVTTIDETVSTQIVRRNWPQPDEPFSVRWDANLLLQLAGVYRFALVSGDDTRLYLDERLAVDNGGEHRLRQVTADVRLDRGVHALRVEHRHERGPVAVELFWAPGQLVSLSLLAGPAVSPRDASQSHMRLRSLRVATRLIVAVTWVVSWVAVLIAFVVVPTVRWFVRHHAPHALRGPPLALLVVIACLYLVGTTWGLPGPGWTPDELSSQDIFDAVGRGFAHGWWHWYPPAHFYLLTIVSVPFLVWQWLDPIAYASSPAPLALFVMFRCVSLAMAVATVLMVYLCGAYLYRRIAPALASACLAALTMPMVYHAKFANVDVPYVFWFTVSLVSLTRIALENSEIDYIVFAVAGTLAICTKDQAYGLYGLPVLALGYRMYASTSSRSPTARIVTMLRQRHLMIAVASSLATFALCHNLVFNAAGFVEHVRFVTLKAAYRMVDPTLGGQWRLWQATWMLMRLSLGWPAFLLCTSGLVLSFWRPEAMHKRLWWVLLPAVSYYITFLMEVRVVYDRFLLPVFVVFALAGGFCLVRLERWWPRWRNWLRFGAAGVLAYSLVYVAAVDAAMLHDSRHALEAWIRANVEPGATIGRVGPIEHMPRIDDHLVQLLIPTAENIRLTSYEYIIVNADWVERFGPGRAERNGVRDLAAGRLGYRTMFESQTAFAFGGIPFTSRFAAFGSIGYSTLTTINPHMVVYKRVNP